MVVGGGGGAAVVVAPVVVVVGDGGSHIKATGSIIPDRAGWPPVQR